MADGAPAALAVNERRTFCRICTGHCGLIVTLDDDGRVRSARGDRDDPHSLGYICSKGSTAPQAHQDGERLLHPLKRQPDGSFAAIPLDQALDEIAARLRDTLARHGPDAVAAFRGTGGFFTTLGLSLMSGWLAALGSHKIYTTLTIDQSAKVVAAYRVGIWPPGKQTFQTADTALMIGGNPMVSMAQLDARNPARRLADAKQRGLKLVVIDPRRTETARFADLFIQPLPGNDAAIVAAIIRLVLVNGWHDTDFCDAHVGDLAALRAAVEPFDAESVAARADITAGEIEACARIFARDGRRGVASTGTGVDMGPHSNLAEHLVEVLNVICGRFIRAGETIPNPGLLMGRGPKPAQVVLLPRPWETGPKSHSADYGLIGGEVVTGKLADDILTPGAGQVRVLLNHGGNPASSVPGQAKMVEALRALDLLVSIDPVMSATARLSDYILPPLLQFERADLPIYLFEAAIFPSRPYTRYTPAVSPPPAGAELCSEWRVLWELARRLGRTMTVAGTPIDMTTPPSEDALFDLVLAEAPVDLAGIRDLPFGYFHPETQVALPADPATAARFHTMPADVQAEVAALLADMPQPVQGEYDFLLSVRRDRHRMNSIGSTLPALRRRTPYNAAHLNPADLARLGLAAGEWMEVRSADGAVKVVADADESVRRGVISLSHGFGGLPGEDDFRTIGASVNMLTTTDRELQPINAMPRMTAIPVNARRIPVPAKAEA